jgi:hypothetical protein
MTVCCLARLYLDVSGWVRYLSSGVVFAWLLYVLVWAISSHC